MKYRMPQLIIEPRNMGLGQKRTILVLGAPINWPMRKKRVVVGAIHWLRELRQIQPQPALGSVIWIPKMVRD